MSQFGTSWNSLINGLFFELVGNDPECRRINFLLSNAHCYIAVPVEGAKIAFKIIYMSVRVFPTEIL